LFAAPSAVAVDAGGGADEDAMAELRGRVERLEGELASLREEVRNLRGGT
jgi:hypothetical protein